MLILSHRGYWKTLEERNTPEAFHRSFGLNFGTETDLRDHQGELVISHDAPTGDVLTGKAFFEIYKRFTEHQFAEKLPLALNIKADGLQTMLRSELENYEIEHYFGFDMSVPDAWVYVQQGLRIFTRQSEFEPVPYFYKEAAGVWMDCFLGDWIDERAIDKHLEAGKQVCLVSPELHRRQPDDFWERLRKMDASASADVMICTDEPERVRAIFS